MPDSGRTAKKSLGQNFLVSKGVVERIIGALDPGRGLPVFEIGPGLGALTVPLAGAGARVAAFEIDGRLAEALSVTLAGYPGVEIVRADIRDVDFDAEAEARGWKRYLICGNIPYLLTSVILLKLPEASRSEGAIIMMQKEVAERILSSPGERGCGILSVFLQAYLDVRKIASAGAGSFRPRPKVDSLVLGFYPGGAAGAPANRRGFLSFLKTAFSQRRKKLGNSLAGGAALAKEDLQEISRVSGADLSKRPEELSMEEWFRVYRGYAGLKG